MLYTMLYIAIIGVIHKIIYKKGVESYVCIVYTNLEDE